MNDVEWDIFMLEIEVRNEALIQEFMIAKMRPRDLAQLQNTQEPIEEELVDSAPRN